MRAVPGLLIVVAGVAAPLAAQSDSAGAAPAAATDPLLVTPQVYRGWKYFQVYCARCHGDNAKGSMAAPDLTYSVSADGGVTVDSFTVMVRKGASTGEMRGFEDLLDAPLIEALYAYVKARSEGGLAPGRPHPTP